MARTPPRLPARRRSSSSPRVRCPPSPPGALGAHIPGGRPRPGLAGLSPAAPGPPPPPPPPRPRPASSGAARAGLRARAGRREAAAAFVLARFQSCQQAPASAAGSGRRSRPRVRARGSAAGTERARGPTRGERRPAPGASGRTRCSRLRAPPPRSPRARDGVRACAPGTAGVALKPSAGPPRVNPVLAVWTWEARSRFRRRRLRGLPAHGPRVWAPEPPVKAARAPLPSLSLAPFILPQDSPPRSRLEALSAPSCLPRGPAAARLCAATPRFFPVGSFPRFLSLKSCAVNWEKLAHNRVP